VVLDVGGVLAENMWEPMFEDLAAAHGIDREDMQAAGRLLWETFAYVPETPANTWRDMERRYWELLLRMVRLPHTVDSLIALTDRYVVLIDGMRPLVERLYQRGTRLLICSNNNEIWWPRLARKLELEKFFPAERVILSSRVGSPKESERLEMFRAVVAAAGVPAAECFFTDDREPMVARARSIGIDAVLFRGSAQFEAELRSRGLL
jgi:HAD superfamily hydrolase (TIGR01509 family)